MKNALSFLASLVAISSVACGVSGAAADPLAGSDPLTARGQACTDATRPEILAQMLQQPLSPPRLIAGLDLAGGASGAGLSHDSVREALCAGTPVVEKDPKATEDSYSWGDGGELMVGFDKTTHLASSWMLSPGYRGAIEFKSRAGGPFGDHTYKMQLGSSILRDNSRFDFSWSDPAARDAAATEIADAIVATFAPDVAPIVGNCRESGRCLVFSRESEEDAIGIIGARDVRFYTYFAGKTFADFPTSGPSMFYGFAPAPTPPTR